MGQCYCLGLSFGLQASFLNVSFREHIHFKHIGDQKVELRLQRKYLVYIVEEENRSLCLIKEIVIAQNMKLISSSPPASILMQIYLHFSVT